MVAIPRQALAAIFDSGVIAAGNFVVAIVLGRVLSHQQYGEYASALMLLMFASMIPMAIVHSPMMVIFPQTSKASARSYRSTLWAMQLTIAVPLCVLCSLLAATWLLSRDQGIEWAAAGGFLIWAMGFLLVEYQRYLLISTSTYAALVATDLLGVAFRLGYLAAFVSEQIHISEIFLALGLTYFLQFFAHIILQRRNALLPALTCSRSYVIQHWNYGKWSLAEGLLYFGSNQLYILLIAAIMGPEQVAAIFAIQTLFNATSFVLNGMGNYSVPKASLLFNRQGLGGMLVFVSRMSIPFGLIVFIYYALLVVGGNDLLSIVFSNKFGSSGALIPILAVAYSLEFFSRPMLIAFRAGGRPHLGFWLKAASALVTLLFGYPLVRAFGPYGAATGQAMSFAVWVMTGSWLIRRWKKQEARSAQAHSAGNVG